VEREKMLAKEHLSLLESLKQDSDFQKIIFAYRKTPIPDSYDKNIYGKHQLKFESVPVPFERVINHQNGDISMMLSNDMGALRFINSGERQRKVREMLKVVHDW
jgi:hypothetical protein